MLRYLIENTFLEQNKRPANLYCTALYSTALTSALKATARGTARRVATIQMMRMVTCNVLYCTVLYSIDDEDGDLGAGLAGVALQRPHDRPVPATTTTVNHDLLLHLQSFFSKNEYVDIQK